MVVTARTVEDKVSTFHLLWINLFTLVVLIAGEMGKRNSGTCKGVESQSRAIKADLVVIAMGIRDASITNPLRWTVGITSAPRIWDTNLRLRAG